MIKELAKLTRTTPSDSQGVHIETIVEAFSQFGSKMVHGYRIVVKKLQERNGMMFDYGTIRVDKEIYLPKPKRFDLKKCYVEAFELLNIN